ncbi:hypothetical protein D3C84_691100 [compost metagenome]
MQGLVAVDRHDPVDQPEAARILGQLGNEIRGPALHQVRAERRVAVQRPALGIAQLGDAAAQQRRIVRFADHDAGRRAALAQHPRGALERAAGAVAADEIVERRIGEGLEDLQGGAAAMGVGIGLVLELAHQEPAMRRRQFLGLADHAAALERGRGEHHPGTEKTQDLAPLDAEILGHGQHQRIALDRADHGQADAGVAAGGFDHRLPRLQGAAGFGRLDHAEGHAVLHRAHGVEGFRLDVQLDAGRAQAVDADHRGAADGGQNTLAAGVHSKPPSAAATAPRDPAQGGPARPRTG